MFAVSSSEVRRYQGSLTQSAGGSLKTGRNWVVVLSTLLLVFNLFSPAFSVITTVKVTTPYFATNAATTNTSSASIPTAAMQKQAATAYGKLPLSFEANAGQTSPNVNFIARGIGYTLFLEPDAATVSLKKAINSPNSSSNNPNKFEPKGVKQPQAQEVEQSVLQLKLVGANSSATAVGQEELPGKSNYFIGNDPTKWQTNVANYSRVEYQNVYPGIGMSYYGNNGQLEYDFNVSAGADPRQIRLDFSGADKLELQADGNLAVHIGDSQLTMPAPFIYQERNGQRQIIQGGYIVQDNHSVTFQLSNYDKSLPLTIDPILSYSTYLGGSNFDYINDVAVDSSGNAYITGDTNSSNFPTTTGAFQTTNSVGPYIAFVTKLNANGTALLYSTYLGSTSDSYGNGIAVDNSGNAYIIGITMGSFPTTAGAFQTTFNGGHVDAFISKLNASGNALVYSTYLGGSSDETPANGIAVDSSGNAYVTGNTFSSNFPTTTGAFQITFNGSSGNGDAFVTKLNPSGTALVYSTYLGGSGNDSGNGIAVDSSGNAYITGNTGSSNFPTTTGAFQTTLNGGSNGDTFVSKLNASGNALVYSTYLGGSGSDSGSGIAVDSSGNAYITGQTGSSNFPTTAGAFQTTFNGSADAFVSKLNASATALIYSTLLGGSDTDSSNGIALDSGGNVYILGETYSNNFPTTAGAFQTTFNGGKDVFVAKLNPNSTALIYSTYLGGSGDDSGSGIALDSGGNAYISGGTYSNNFPTTTGTFQTTYNGGCDGFVAKFQLAGVGVPATIGIEAGGVQNAAVNSSFPTALAVVVKDINGTPVPNATVTFSAPVISSSNATGTFPNSSSTVTATTDVNGVATAPTLTANGQVGGYVVTASVLGAIAPVNFNLYNTQIVTSPPVISNTISPSNPVITSTVAINAIQGSPTINWTADLVYDQFSSRNTANAQTQQAANHQVNKMPVANIVKPHPAIGHGNVVPSSGTVSPSQPTSVTVTIDTSGLSCGTHNATLYIRDTSNPNNNVAVSNFSTTITSCNYNLPFVANNWNNFTTYIAVQNTGTATANVSTQFFGAANSQIAIKDLACNSIAPGGECILPNPFTSGNHGSGVINSNQPLSVIASEATPYGGSAYAIGSGDSGSTLYVPFAINNSIGFKTQITVANFGSAAASGTISFYDTNGNHVAAADKNFNIATNFILTYDQTASDSGLPFGFYGWAQIQGAVGSQLSAQVLEQNPGNHFVAIANAQPFSSTQLYAPAIFNGAYGGFVTGANLVNPSSVPVTVNITYYDQQGKAFPSAPFTIPSNGVQAIFSGASSGIGLPTNGLPAQFAGTASISVTSSNAGSTNYGVIMTVNEGGGLTAQGTARSGVYNAAEAGSNAVSLPAIANNGVGGFTTGTTILNISNNPINGLITYYNLDGSPTGISQQFPNLAPHSSYAIYQGAAGLPDNFYGVAVVSVLTGGSSDGNDLVVTTNVQSNAFFYTYTEPN